ncbi:MAG TPA: lytic murein transglycosylase [Candidatus Competibacteraceae bacterium]|nr:lytic murein transglycosylase [Candidatus Competibacteraceae bacterium]
MIQRRSGHGGGHHVTPAASGTGARRPPKRWRTLPLLLLVSSVAGDVGATESPQSWRERFQTLDRSLQNGEPADYSALLGYSLYPYLRYRELSRRPAEFPAAEIREFLKNYSDSPLAGKLRDAWLRQLASAQRWDDYLREATPSRDPGFECWRRQALLATGQGERALHDFEVFWLRGGSLPASCDPVIAYWRTQGGPPVALLWQRFTLAMTERNLGLARFLRPELSAADQPLADLWLAVAGNPQLILDASHIRGDDPRIGAVFADALKQWGKRDAQAAAAALDTLKERHRTLASHWVEVERQLALWIASDYHPTALARLTALPEPAVDATVREWRVRVCLHENQWAAALQWLDQLPAPERDKPRWQYWRGRLLETLDRGAEARQAYEKVSGQRDYYGFLAADRLGTPYAIANIPLQASATELEALLAGSVGLQRARELYILGREPEAAAEWRQAIESFDRAMLQQAALLADRWEWHSQAIATLARTEYWDDLNVRFPLAYKNGVLDNARASALDPAWVYAIIRQESNFRPAARSPVGALGLMQLVPATGRDIARQSGDATDGAPESLLQPDTNLRLGVRYLQQMLERLQGNPVLATAAYNAGPTKVARWLPARAPVPADIWAETIPYQETRNYVQRVLEYATIYTQRLGLPQADRRLGSRMKPVLAIEPAPGNPG